MNLKEHFKDKLHNAVLFEGDKSFFVPKIIDLLEKYNFSIINNPDFFHLSFDSIKIDDVRKIKEMISSKTFSSENNSKKVFLISTNNILIEAQNSMLKIFEEIKDNNHFFILIPSIDLLLSTFISRFYLLSYQFNELEEKLVLDFLKMNLNQKFLFIKELVKEEDEKDVVFIESSHTKAIRFLNHLEILFYNKILKEKVSLNEKHIFEHIFKTRRYLRQPGSSSKTLLESVAILLPKI